MTNLKTKQRFKLIRLWFGTVDSVTILTQMGLFAKHFASDDCCCNNRHGMASVTTHMVKL